MMTGFILLLPPGAVEQIGGVRGGQETGLTKERRLGLPDKKHCCKYGEGEGIWRALIRPILEPPSQAYGKNGRKALPPAG